jgi:hypothetical protein
MLVTGNMYDRLLLCCRLSDADVIFAPVSNQCPQGPPIREHSHLNVAGRKLGRFGTCWRGFSTLDTARFEISRRMGAA